MRRLVGASRYERTEARRGTRAGSYERKLYTITGEVKLKPAKLRKQTFGTAIIERYRRPERPVEEALMEMYLAGVSACRVEDITEALWGTRVSPGTVSNLDKKICVQIEACRRPAICGKRGRGPSRSPLAALCRALCVVHWYTIAFSHIPGTKVREVALMLKAIHAQEYLQEGKGPITTVVDCSATIPTPVFSADPLHCA